MTAPLSPPWLAWPQTQALVAAFASAPGALRFVGGAVRDALLGVEAKDVDAATSLKPEAVMELLADAGIQAIPTGLAHGTVTALVAGKPFEITTLRRDAACDGRHAQVEFTDNWQEDSARRDFTMNALYLSPEGELFDFWGGAEDARAGRVRFIGDATARVEEDYLRILRFYRFFAHYGKAEPDAAAQAACLAGAAGLSGISGERVQAELMKLMAAPKPSGVLLMMEGAGVMEAALGMSCRASLMMGRLEEIEALAGDVLAPEERFATLLLSMPVAWEEAVKLLFKRLRLSARVEKAWRAWLPYAMQLERNFTVAEQKHLLRLLGAGHYTAMVMLAWARSEDDIAARSPYMKMLKLAREWQAPLFPVSGNDLLGAGIPPGRLMGEVLRQLQDAWERSDYQMTRDELLERAKALV